MTIQYYPIAGAPKNICAGYGNRTYPDGSVKLHDADDLCAPLTTPIVAVDDGSVTYAFDSKGGNVAVLRTDEGTAYYHAHLYDTGGTARRVRAGEQIGRVGMTGNAALVGIPHLHFQVWAGGTYASAHPDPTQDLRAAPLLGAPKTSRSNLLVAAGVGAVIVTWSTALAMLLRRRRPS